MRPSAFALTFALTALAAQAAAEPVTCMIAGEKTRLEHVHVALEGGQRLDLSVVDASARVFPRRRAGSFGVDVEAPIFFHGVVAEAPIRVAREVSAWEGAMSIEPGLAVEEVRWDGETVRGRVDLGGHMTVSRVPLPCDALTLDPPDRSLVAKKTAPARADGEMVGGLVPVGQLLTFAKTPGSRETVLLDQGPWSLTMLDHFKDEGPFLRPWTRVRANLHGMTIVGWVARSAVTVPTGFRGEGGSGHSSSLLGCGTILARGPKLRIGPATITKDTLVYAAPGREAWATIVRPTGYVVRLVTGEAWATIEKIEGITGLGSSCGKLEKAFVPADTVTFL